MVSKHRDLSRRPVPAPDQGQEPAASRVQQGSGSVLKQRRHWRMRRFEVPEDRFNRECVRLLGLRIRHQRQLADRVPAGTHRGDGDQLNTSRSSQMLTLRRLGSRKTIPRAWRCVSRFWNKRAAQQTALMRFYDAKLLRSSASSPDHLRRFTARNSRASSWYRAAQICWASFAAVTAARLASIVVCDGPQPPSILVTTDVIAAANRDRFIGLVLLLAAYRLS